MVGARVVGREAELATVDQFLDSVALEAGGLLLLGDAGIGKTTVWQAAVQRAKERRVRVLVARPGPAETRITFAGLADVLSSVGDDVLQQLPPPQRRALEVALIRTDPGDRQRSPDQRSIAIALLSVLRSLSQRSPLLVCLDDLQWLDRSSWSVLEFALRRLDSDRIGVLASLRLEPDGSPPRSFARLLGWDRMRQLRLGPLKLAALHEILRRELAHTMSRPTLVRIERTSAGNPLFALELARAILASGQPVQGSAPLPVPVTLKELIDERLRRLPAASRRALLVTSALSQPTLELVDSEALAPAEEAGVVRVEVDGRVAFSHPMLASAVYASASALQRRAVHRTLAETVSDGEERVRHLALSAQEPSEAIAQALEVAAQRARMRGAPEGAAELLELAIRLTPRDSRDKSHTRLLAAAEDYFRAGDLARSKALAQQVAEASAPGRVTGGALELLGEIRYQEESFAEAIPLFEQALDELREDPRRVWVLVNLAYAHTSLGDLPGAVAPARAAIDEAARCGDDPLRAVALAVAAMVDWYLGRPPDWQRLDLALALEDPDLQIVMPMRPSLIAGVILVHSDDLPRARAVLDGLRKRTIDRGDDSELPLVDVQLAMLERYQGRLDASAAYAEEGFELARQLGSPAMQTIMLAERCLTRTTAGDISGARADIAMARELVSHTDYALGDLWSRSAMGCLELSVGNALAAREAFEPIMRGVEARGALDPIAAAYLRDAIETLVAVGELERAHTLATLVSAYADTVGRHQVALASRAAALVLAARGDIDAALDRAAQAIDAFSQLPLPLGLARALLVKGQIHRRRKEKLLAREAFSQSEQIFSAVGAPLWADRARAELRRVGLRALAPDELTQTEQRVAALAAAGLRNQQIADRVFVSPKTVEANLARIYRKLGVRSRAELAARFHQRAGPFET